MKKSNQYLITFILVSFFLSSCSLFTPKKNLSPDHQEFLSKVRYIITQKEKKRFLKLAPSKRDEFIEEFWEKRDPDPETEENEFKKKYFERIEEANHLFAEGATAGWLEDRGRIYILLGPPEHRDAYPRGYTFYGPPMEIWYYGIYPIVFTDKFYSGDYNLEPGSAQNLALLLKAQMDLKPDVEMDRVPFDFNLKLEKLSPGQIKIQVHVPYETISFKEEKEKLQTILSLHMEIFTQSQEKIWNFQKDYPLSLTPERLKEKRGKSYVIPFQKEFSPGTYRVTVSLENQTDTQTIEKSKNFRIKKEPFPHPGKEPF
ncbi:GWxTD domain-containing protein [bacterium]|nr:GWxTD domain-containing protein [bacterium]